MTENELRNYKGLQALFIFCIGLWTMIYNVRPEINELNLITGYAIIIGIMIMLFLNLVYHILTMCKCIIDFVERIAKLEMLIADNPNIPDTLLNENLDSSEILIMNSILGIAQDKDIKKLAFDTGCVLYSWRQDGAKSNFIIELHRMEPWALRKLEEYKENSLRGIKFLENIPFVNKVI